MEKIQMHFPGLTPAQITQFGMLEPLYADWNSRINVISRRDIDSLYIKHVLHSLAIAKIQPFEGGSTVLDVGTGGGFPGIPLAILFPDTQFFLVDSIMKKITVVQAVADALGLTNVKAQKTRAETVHGKFDFVISRAVTQMPEFVGWVKGKIKPLSRHQLQNGILYLKGGDLSDELRSFPNAVQYPISKFFDDDFFDTKKVVHLPLK